MKLYLSAALCLVLFTACSSSSSTPDNSDGDDQNSVLTGVFLDSAVEGLAYATETQSGTTNAAGEFNYLAGEQVIFSIGAAQFPGVAAALQVTPVDIGASSATPEAMTTNIARFLQSLDLDGNPNNGITISADAATNSVSQLNFDVSITDFEDNPEVINLVANSGSVNTSLISAEDANSHLNSILGSGITSSIDGIWLQTSQTDADAKDERSRVQITINGFGSGKATGRLWIEFYEGDDGQPCSTWRDFTYVTSTSIFSVPEDGGSMSLNFTQPNGPDRLTAIGEGATSTYRRLDSRLPAIAWDCSNSDIL